MARILVQRAAQKADTLEELDRLLASPEIHNPAEHTDAPPSSPFDRGLLASAERLLAVYLGPIAPLLVRRAASRAPDPDSLADLLAGELANEAEQQAFLAAFKHTLPQA